MAAISHIHLFTFKLHKNLTIKFFIHINILSDHMANVTYWTVLFYGFKDI